MSNNTVLVIDDEELVGTMAKAMLEALGYDAIHCFDAATGLETFKRIHKEVRFVLLDMLLPDMSGIDLYRSLREVDPDLTCILSSGYSKDAAIESLLVAGVNGFIQKPFRIADLEAAINQACSV